MEIIVKDGVRFLQHTFDKESDFEKVVLQQTKQIFGKDALLFKKQKIKTETGIGTIPDAFVVCPSIRKWYVVEVELASHDVYRHIIPQITKFKSALDNNSTRKILLKYFDREIESDLHKLADWTTTTGDQKNVHRVLSEIIDYEPELVIIIDSHNPELETASSSIKFSTRINVFKTYNREGLGFGDFIYHFETSALKKSTSKSKLHHSSNAEIPYALEREIVSIDNSFKNENTISINSTPSEWVKSVPELSSIQGLNNWKNICDHLKVKHEGDSARRALKRWVEGNRSDWPPVPEYK